MKQCHSKSNEKSGNLWMFLGYSSSRILQFTYPIFPKKCANFNFSGKYKYDIFAQLSVTKFIIRWIHTQKKCADSVTNRPRKHHTIPAEVLPNTSEALFKNDNDYWKHESVPLTWYIIKEGINIREKPQGGGVFIYARLSWNKWIKTPPPWGFSRRTPCPIFCVF